MLLLLAACPPPAQAQDSVTAAAPAAREEREDALRCLTLAIAYEAGNQTRAGQEAVAEVVLNRVGHPAFPKTVCGVVFQGSARATGCQFTFTCDGALRRRLADRTMAGARAVAAAALDGRAAQRVAGALNYHASYVQPGWAPSLQRVAQIGAHIFYRPVSGGAPVAGRGGDPEYAGFDRTVLARAWAPYAGTASLAVAEQDSAASAAAAPAPPAVAPKPARPEVFAPWGLGRR